MRPWDNRFLPALGDMPANLGSYQRDVLIGIGYNAIFGYMFNVVLIQLGLFHREENQL